MLTPNRVFVPIDFSEGSARALAYAFHLADGHDADIDVVHVWQPPSFVSPELLVFDPNAEQVSLHDWVRTEAQRAMADFMEDKRPPRGVRVTARLEHGDPVETIERIVDETEPDLVVLTTHGRTGMARLLAGSVAERVVRAARCPVMTLPAT